MSDIENTNNFKELTMLDASLRPYFLDFHNRLNELAFPATLVGIDGLKLMFSLGDYDETMSPTTGLDMKKPGESDNHVFTCFPEMYRNPDDPASSVRKNLEHLRDTDSKKVICYIDVDNKEQTDKFVEIFGGKISEIRISGAAHGAPMNFNDVSKLLIPGGRMFNPYLYNLCKKDLILYQDREGSRERLMEKIDAVPDDYVKLGKDDAHTEFLKTLTTGTIRDLGRQLRIYNKILALVRTYPFRNKLEFNIDDIMAGSGDLTADSLYGAIKNGVILLQTMIAVGEELIPDAFISRMNIEEPYHQYQLTLVRRGDDLKTANITRPEPNVGADSNSIETSQPTEVPKPPTEVPKQSMFSRLKNPFTKKLGGRRRRSNKARRTRRTRARIGYKRRSMRK